MEHLENNKSQCCGCQVNDLTNKNHQSSSWKKILKSVPSTMLSILIAFFPKCPMCWMVYMSLFSGIGLSQLPYMPWLLPVMFVILSFHMYFMFKKTREIPMIFYTCLAGAVFILLGRLLFVNHQWVSVVGMILLISSSLWANFSSVFSFIQVKSILNNK